MRLKLKISRPRRPVPFDHIHMLTGVLHKWLGPNNSYHDGLSLYSFSWLQGSQARDGALFFPHGATWFISSHDDNFLNRSINGILADPEINWGMRVEEVTIEPEPDFGHAPEECRFSLASPVFLKRALPDGGERHYVWSDPESDELLTTNMCFKLEKAGLSPAGVSLRFDRSYLRASTKLMRYGKKYEYRASMCPVIFKGSPAQKAFAWCVGVGQATGLGFGAVR